MIGIEGEGMNEQRRKLGLRPWEYDFLEQQHETNALLGYLIKSNHDILNFLQRKQAEDSNQQMRERKHDGERD